MGYPYPAPSHPFVQQGHETFDPSEVEVDWGDRVPVLAYGSNAAPQALAHKLALSDDPVLVVPAWLRDFDVVYSAHISPYGAVPATLQRSPGTAARVHVAHMTNEQVVLVSATEPNYEAVTLAGVDCRPDGGEPVTRLSAYFSHHGCLLVEGSEVALSAVQASDRTFAAMSEPEVLEYVRAACCPGDSIEEFVLANVTDPALAETRTATLPRRSGPLP
ncbi:MAG TPA: hypothetical protein VHR65_03395 [Solirubrobacterales bacterium]|nr:hypothetical protein [Solirubrobacterales bacterium]